MNINSYRQQQNFDPIGEMMRGHRAKLRGADTAPTIAGTDVAGFDDSGHAIGTTGGELPMFESDRRAVAAAYDPTRELIGEQVRGQRLLNTGRERELSAVDEMNRRADSLLSQGRDLRAAGRLRPAGPQEAEAMSFHDTPAGRLRSSGAPLTPEILAELTRDEMRYGETENFVPSEMQTPSGLPMVQTSRKSWIPDPRVKSKLKRPGSAEGPEYSKDRKFYRNGPDDPWKPISGGSEDPNYLAAADLRDLPGQIAQLEVEIANQAKEIRSGDNRNWYGRSRSDLLAKKQAELNEAKRRLKEARGSQKNAAAADAEDEAAAGDQASGSGEQDPISYVLGN